MTKNREPLVTDAIVDALNPLITKRLSVWGGECVEVTYGPDHLHLVFSLAPKYKLSEFVNALKSSTSRHIRKQFEMLGNFWDKRYCLVTEGNAPISSICEYLRA